MRRPFQRRGRRQTSFTVPVTQQINLRGRAADGAVLTSVGSNVFGGVIDNGEGGPAVTLNALSLSAIEATNGEASTIGIIGTTPGSALSVQSGALPTGMTLNSGARTISGTPSVNSVFNFTLRETLGGATNSPRDSALTITVAAAGTISPLSLSSFLMPDTATTGTALITLTGGVAGATVTLEDDLVAAQADALQVSGHVIQAGAGFAALRHGTYRLGIRMIAGATERYYETFVTKYAAGAPNVACSTESALTAALAAATTNGGATPFVIDLDPGVVWASRTWSTNIPAGSHRVIVRTAGNHISGSKARIDRGLASNLRAFMFQHTQHVSLGLPGLTDSTGFSGNLQAEACFNMQSSSTNDAVEFFRCDIVGGYNANKLAPLDPTGDIDPASRDYPFYAGFLCNYPSTATGKIGAVASTSTATGLTLWPSGVNIPLDNTSVRNLTFNADPALNEQVFIGTNTPDDADTSPGNGGWPATGGYTILFRKQTGWTGVEAVARFRVEAGWITGFIVDNWGSGYQSNVASGTHHPALTAGWPRRLTMWNRLVNGITNLRNVPTMKVTECTFANLLNATGSTSPQQEQMVGCTMRSIYADFVPRFSDETRQTEKESIFAFNVMHGHMGEASDTPNVHGDFFQTRTTAANSWQRLQLIGNLCDVGNARGDVQGAFLSDNFTLPQVVGVPSTSVLDFTIVGNVFRTSLTNGLAVVTVRDGLAWRNIFIGHPTRAPSSGVSGFGSGSSLSAAIIGNRIVTQGALVAVDNVANSIAPPGNASVRSINYQVIGGVSNYPTVFSGSTVNTLTTPAAFKAALTNAGALIGTNAGVWEPGDTDPVVNHEGRNWQPERVPIVVPFGRRTDIIRSAVTTSPVRRVWRGNKTTGISISVSAGTEWQSANDEAMTSIIQNWTSSPGTIAYGKYYRVRHTASGSFYSFVNSTVTLNGFSNTFQTLTEDVDNGGPVAPGATAFRSTTGVTMGAANVYARHVLLAFKFRTPSALNGTDPATGQARGSVRLFMFGNNRTSVLINNLGACSVSINGAVLNLGAVIKADTEHTMIIKLDRTIVSPAVNPADDTLYNVYPDSAVVILDGADITPRPAPDSQDTTTSGNGTTGSNGVAWNSGSGVDGTGTRDHFLVFATGSAMLADRVSLFGSALTTPADLCGSGYKLHWVAIDWETTARPASFDATHIAWLDIRDDNTITKFSNDRFIAAQAGDATQWPLQREFKVLYQPTVADLNAGTAANEGSLTLLNTGAGKGGVLSFKQGTGTFT